MKHNIDRSILIELLIEQYRAEHMCMEFKIYGNPVKEILNGDMALKGSRCYDLFLSTLRIDNESSLYYEANEKFMDEIIGTKFKDLNNLIYAINKHIDWLEKEKNKVI